MERGNALQYIERLEYLYNNHDLEEDPYKNMKYIDIQNELWGKIRNDGFGPDLMNAVREKDFERAYEAIK